MSIRHNTAAPDEKADKPIIRIIDYKAGNAPSVMHAVSHLGYDAGFARGPRDIETATHIILPGVGSARATISSLGGMDILGLLKDLVIQKEVLFLGICVGLQILFEHSEEENAECLGWLKGKVVRFDASKDRVPQMGWNLVNFIKGTPLQNTKDDYFYFVNSYYAIPENTCDIWAESNYNGPFAAAVSRRNIYAAQFHIEKSGKAGLSLLDNFLGNQII